MTVTSRDGFYFAAVGWAIFVLLGSVLAFTMDWSMADFNPLYTAARCLHGHGDPYNSRDVLLAYGQETGKPLDQSSVAGEMAIRNVYPPTQFLFTFPITWLPYSSCRLLWMVLNIASLTAAAFLIFRESAAASISSGLLIGFLLANSETFLAMGNAAGIAVGLCGVSAWCFLRNRYSAVGVVCLALSLMLKPQDAGLVWLFFLLSGGTPRKRALQTLYVVLGLSIPILLAMNAVAPHWFSELQANRAFFAQPGNNDDPGPTAMMWPTAMINLQTVISLANNSPGVYNPVAYLLCALVLLPIGYATLRSKPSHNRAWVALAAVSALTMLPIYHRRHDARLLLLMIPACAVLWSEGRRRGLMALVDCNN